MAALRGRTLSISSPHGPAVDRPPTPATAPAVARLGARSRRRLPSLDRFGAVLLALTCVLTVPAFAGAMPPGGEYNYVAAEIVALREHLQWGTQVVWSYGPLGYMNEPVYFDFSSWIVAFTT